MILSAMSFAGIEEVTDHAGMPICLTCVAGSGDRESVFTKTFDVKLDPLSNELFRFLDGRCGHA